MKEPTRLEEGAATAFERQLFDAAKRQVPGAALKARMQEGLGLSAATAPVQTVVTKSFALGGKAKVLLAVVAVAAAVTVPLVWTKHRGTPPSQVNATPGTSPQVEDSLLPDDDMSRSKAAAAASAANAPGTLLEEIRLLDRVRGAMSAGEPRRALAELEQYDLEYPRGAFSPEATVLRVEALDAVGDSRAARALGEQFLARHPNNPLAQRVARIVQR